MADTDLIDRLVEEGDLLETIVSKLPDEAWRSNTPAVGWTIAHQIAHLAWTDEMTLAALTNPEEFAKHKAAFDADPQHIDTTAEHGARQSPADILHRWRTSKSTVAQALASADPTEKFPWFGPPMKAKSMATARAMETWAHSQDIRDTLELTQPNPPTLRDVTFFGIITRDFAYQLNGLTPPAEPFRFELTSPDGEQWTWGPAADEAKAVITGPALDFCLAVTQRRETEDLDLRTTGPQAAEAMQWLTFAQAFAGDSKSEVRKRQVRG